MKSNGSTPVLVQEMGAEEAAAWDAYVHAQPSATFFHLSGWRTVLERAFGHRTHYLVARRLGEVCGVLPLARVRSLLFGDSLISTPFCAYGGVVASDEQARVALEQSAAALADALGVDYLEVRNREPGREDWPRKDLYVTFSREIPADPEAILASVPRKQRAMVRKGIQAGLAAEIDRGTDRLYAVYSESTRNLGTPVFSRRYLDVLMETFGEAAEILMVTHQGRPVSGVLSFYFRDAVLPYYGGGVTASRELYSNDFMYYELMCRARRSGINVFDFGRSKVESGAYHYKRHWGFEAQPLAYEYYLSGARDMPNLSPNNPKYRALINVWRRMPLWSARLLGPPIARHLG